MIRVKYKAGCVWLAVGAALLEEQVKAGCGDASIPSLHPELRTQNDDHRSVRHLVGVVLNP